MEWNSTSLQARSKINGKNDKLAGKWHFLGTRVHGKGQI